MRRLNMTQDAGLCILLVIVSATRAFAAQSTLGIPLVKIDQAVIVSLPSPHAKQAHVVDHLDLTGPFSTRTQWTLVVAKFGGPPPSVLSLTEDGGPLAICFVKELKPRCTYEFGRNGSSASWFGIPYHFLSGKVVFSSAKHTDPLLLLKTTGPYGGNASHVVDTELFMYDRRTNRFKSVFASSVGSNNNQEVRFVEHGSLRGAIVVATPTATAPYAYWISVYVPNKENQYSRSALRYRSDTTYGDGNPLPVIDAEMRNILKRLGKWKTGDPLPIPPGMPRNCTRRLFLRGGEEWCV